MNFCGESANLHLDFGHYHVMIRMLSGYHDGKEGYMSNPVNTHIFEIKTYMIIWRQMEIRNIGGVMVNIRGIVRCSGDDGYVMDVIFVSEESDYPEPIYEVENKKGFLFMPISDMLAFVDTLRNESPIYGHLRGDKPEWMSVTTSQELVGEGERN
jgi:hypothetical protein